MSYTKQFTSCLSVCLLLATVSMLAVPLPSLAQPASAGEPEVRSDFLRKLEGDWRMEGKFQPYPGGDWIPTGSSMSATLDLDRRLLVRDIEAPQIGFEAYDILWFDEARLVYTYLYLNSQSPVKIYRVGTATGADEITVHGDDPPGRTVIELLDADTMVARDFEPLPEGGERMTREVMHYRVGSEAGEASDGSSR